MSEVDEYAGDRAEEKAYAVGANTHWVFFETIDEDLHSYSRYLEFHDKNFSAFSINLARLYLSISSEVDVLAKMICERAVQSPEQRSVIGDRHLDDKIRILEPYPSLQHWIVVDFKRSMPPPDQ